MQQWQATSRKFEGRHRRALIMKLSFWFIHNRTASKEFSVSKLVTSFLHLHSWMMTCDHPSVCATCLFDRQILLLALGEAHVVRSEESTWEPAPSKTEFYFHTLPSHSGQQRFTRQCLAWVSFLFPLVVFPPLCRSFIQQKTANWYQQENDFRCWKTTESVTEKNEWLD